MPVVLKHIETNQIYTCMLTNHYRLEYYGTKYWDDWDLATNQKEEYLQLQGENDEDWELIEIEDNKMKIFNVRLKNDPKYDLFLDKQGSPIVKKNE